MGGNFDGLPPTPPPALKVEVELLVVEVELLLRPEPSAHPGHDDGPRGGQASGGGSNVGC